MDRDAEFSDDGDSNLRSGKFRYIANSKHGGYPIGIYRLKYRAKTSDTGKGIEAERTRVSHWKNELIKL